MSWSIIRWLMRPYRMRPQAQLDESHVKRSGRLSSSD